MKYILYAIQLIQFTHGYRDTTRKLYYLVLEECTTIHQRLKVSPTVIFSLTRGQRSLSHPTKGTTREMLELTGWTKKN